MSSRVPRPPLNRPFDCVLPKLCKTVGEPQNKIHERENIVTPIPANVNQAAARELIFNYDDARSTSKGEHEHLRRLDVLFAAHDMLRQLTRQRDDSHN